MYIKNIGNLWKTGLIILKKKKGNSFQHLVILFLLFSLLIGAVRYAKFPFESQASVSLKNYFIITVILSNEYEMDLNPNEKTLIHSLNGKKLFDKIFLLF